MIESYARVKRTKQRLIRMLMDFFPTLTYRGGEASSGGETADQEDDGEAGAGAGDSESSHVHCISATTHF